LISWGGVIRTSIVFEVAGDGVGAVGSFELSTTCAAIKAAEFYLTL